MNNLFFFLNWSALLNKLLILGSHIIYTKFSKLLHLSKQILSITFLSAVYASFLVECQCFYNTIVIAYKYALLSHNI